MSINPIRLDGTWDEGYTLDVHTRSSFYIGEDVYGHPKFDTVYSDMGALINEFKYKHKYDKLEEIMMLAENFVIDWANGKDIDFVLPVPPSKNRTYQPAQEIGMRIADLIKASYQDDILHKQSTIESKGLSSTDKGQIHGTIIKYINAANRHNVLLVDDLYDSGATLTECVRVLREDPKIERIYVLTMTKTRKG